MAKTFLTLVQDLHRETGAAGAAPSTVTGQTGESSRMVNWILTSDSFVQNLWARWKFMRSTYSQPTVASQSENTAPADWKSWDVDTFFLDGDPLSVVEYNDVKSEFYDATIEGVPSRVILMPDGNLRFDPVPDGIYTITADYYTTNVAMVNNGDFSVIPGDFHDVILGRALMLYGNYENAPEVKAQGAEIYGDFITRLESSQLPNAGEARYKGSGGFFEVIAEN